MNDLPDYLRDDAPYKQCSVCGRKSWDKPEVQSICWMTQPDGKKCQGVLRLAHPTTEHHQEKS